MRIDQGEMAVVMKRRLFWSLAAVTAALALVAGSGTFGFFSDSRINPGNVFEAGILVLGNDRDETFILSMLNMQPGDQATRTVTLSRAPGSTLDMNYSVRLGAAVGALCGALNLVVTRVDQGQEPNDGAAIVAGAVVSSGGATVASFAATPVSLGSLNNSGNSEDTYSFQVTFTDTGEPQNELQGTTCEATYIWDAVQQSTNDDLTVLPPS